MEIVDMYTSGKRIKNYLKEAMEGIDDNKEYHLKFKVVEGTIEAFNRE